MIRNYENSYEKWNIFVAWPHLWLKLEHTVRELWVQSEELVSRVIANLKRGKAMDIDGLSAEHLQFCHPILPVILKLSLIHI